MNDEGNVHTYKFDALVPPLKENERDEGGRYLYEDGHYLWSFTVPMVPGTMYPYSYDQISDCVHCERSFGQSYYDDRTSELRRFYSLVNYLLAVMFDYDWKQLRKKLLKLTEVKDAKESKLDELISLEMEKIYFVNRRRWLEHLRYELKSYPDMWSGLDTTKFDLTKDDIFEVVARIGFVVNGLFFIFTTQQPKT